MKKRIFSLVLTLVLLCAMIPPITQQASAASTYWINGVGVRYNTFSSAPDDCWMYANNLYNYIYGTYHSNSFYESNNMLRNLSTSQLTLTKAHLKEYVTAAKVGSVLRICDEYYLYSHDGWGHSQFIVYKDAYGFTVLEGGLYNWPYCREKYYTWDEYINTWGYPYIKYIKYPGAPAYSGVKTKSYAANCKVEVTADVLNIRSEPRSTSGNTVIDSAKYGTTFRAYKLIKNEYGELWYKIKTKSGKTGYIYAGYTKYLRDYNSDIKATGMSVPTKHVAGKIYVLTGSIKSTYNKLVRVSVRIYKGTKIAGKTSITGTRDDVSKNKYNLAGSYIDNCTEFNKLSTGTYTYVVRARYKNYYAKSATAIGSNTDTIILYRETFKVVKK